jgi:hypothetical protein
MSSVKVALDSSHEVGYTEHLSAFPGRFTETQRKTIAQNGVIKPGTIVREGDPLLLMVRKNPPKIGTMGRRTFSDRSVVWDKEDPGIVTDVTKSKDGWRIQVRSNHPMRLGDKISNRYGGKGVVTAILPDAQMPRDVDGKSFDMIGNSFAVDSRTNPAYIIELALGKVAAKTGTAYSMPSFDKSRGTLLDFAKRELKSAGLTDKESVYLPEFNTTVPSVMTGVGYFHKLQQMSEDKSGGESFSGYTLDKQPVTSGGASKRFGSMEVHAILSQGATDFLKDAKLIKGQENYDYWRDLREGRNPTMPTSNFIKDKFLGLVQAAGVNVERKGGKTHIFGMTNSQAASLTGDREVTSADTFDPKRLQPVPGGLFDEKATGGSDGDKFAFIRLPEPMLNPLMEDSIRRILGTTKEELGDLISGKTPYKGLRGGLALAKRLKDINIDNEIALAKQEASGSSSSKRDAAVKKLRALLAIKKQDIQLVDLMLTRVPVLPPRFRPITVSDDGAMASDANYLYRELIHNKDSFSQAAAILPDEQQVDARRALYHSFKAVVGLGDTENAELHQKNVQGLLSHVFGKGSSKYGMFQRRILGIPVNLSTRAVIINDVTLGMDQVGLPEKRAWELYEPFVMRRMVRAGWPQTQSAKLIAERKPEALKYLQEEVKVRPMVINRAPTLYKWNMTGAWPVLIKDGDPLRLPNIILKGHNADFDGDTLNAHIPVTDEAVKDVVTKMMPSKMLFWSRTHKPAYVPTMDYLHGLYVASSNPTSKPAKEYNTDAEAIAAYKRGELDVNDPVRIKTTSLR